MNLFGKILVALNLVMALVFMGFAIAVYSTHTNWRDVVQRKPEDAAPPLKPKGLVYQVEDLLTKNDALLKQIEALKSEVSQEKKLRDGRLALLETEKEKLKKDVETKTAEIQAITEDKSKTTAAIEALTTEVGKKSMELEALSADLEAKKGQAEDLHDQVVIKTGQLAELGATLAKLQQQMKELVAKTTPAASTVAAPKIDGYVRAANKDMVEISLGSDDGVARGQQMFVYRPGTTAAAAKLIGRIEILQTTADVSVGKVIPEYSKGLIEKDDRVATRFN
jgi:myosin heavy subunit